MYYRERGDRVDSEPRALEMATHLVWHRHRTQADTRTLNEVRLSGRGGRG